MWFIPSLLLVVFVQYLKISLLVLFVILLFVVFPFLCHWHWVSSFIFFCLFLFVFKKTKQNKQKLKKPKVVMTMSLISWATRMRTYRKLLVEFWVQSVLTLLKDLIHFLFCVVIEQFSQFHKQGSTSCQELGDKMTGLAHLGDWRGMRAHTSWLERNWIDPRSSW